ncbi:MAG: FAD-dependent oxidoreductase [Clostridia bacterium]|nr:FAD-dependent oxidoreductase [Clostridia bacterium]
MYDIIIIGGGPAGLTAAVYSRRANKSVLVIEKSTFGGQITFSPKVENIPGFLSLSGNEFAEKLVEQVISLGADVEMCEVTKIIDGDVKTVVTDGGNFEGRAVIIATGAKHRLLGLENEEKLIGNGISFCAVCDGAFYKDKTVAVIGGGNSAIVETLLLADLAKKVYVIQNLEMLTAEQKLIEQLNSKPNVEVIYSTVVSSLIGDTELSAIRLKNQNGESSELKIDGMFVAIGLVPQNEIFSEVLELDEHGYISAFEDGITNAKGIFVAGDCRTKKVRQVTTACSDGAVAAIAATDYLDNN